MNDPAPMAATHEFTRRDVLRAAVAMPFASPSLLCLPAASDAALLVIELEGGNDGLNTLIPVEDAAYVRARPKLASVRAGAHPVAPGFALHPALAQCADLFRRGVMAAVQGVGYANPDRSHFKSRDIWHSADADYEAGRSAATGWLGRAADVLSAGGASMPALALGGYRLPLALRGERVVVPVLENLDDCVLRDAATTLSGRSAALAASGGDDSDLHAFVRDTGRAAVASAETLQRALSAYRARAEYPAGALGTHLQLAARALVSGPGVRLAHVACNGFDTHAQQLSTHAELLRQVDAAVAALVADLEAHGRLAATVILICSEFGRRVAENSSLGTDHGAAAPVFLVGGGVVGGLHGSPPDLGDLLDGDVRATADFRQVYGAVLERLGIAAPAVIAGGLDPLRLFA